CRRSANPVGRSKAEPRSWSGPSTEQRVAPGSERGVAGMSELRVRSSWAHLGPRRSYMADLAEGESVEVKGSAAKPYVLSLRGGASSCPCPAWRNQGAPIERRTCKHLRALRGDATEDARVGAAPAPKAPAARAQRAPTSGGTADEQPGATAPP